MLDLDLWHRLQEFDLSIISLPIPMALGATLGATLASFVTIVEGHFPSPNEIELKANALEVRDGAEWAQKRQACMAV